MSAPLAGKFQDHYAILGVDPKANSETIQAAYAKAAEKYRPSNSATGDQAKFDAVNVAYETLSDAGLRAEFDKVKGVEQDDDIAFSGPAFFGVLGRQGGLRSAILSVLYDRRQRKPFRPSLSMRHLDGLLKVSNDDLNFALWYLKQKGLAASDDKSNLVITVEGMDYLERSRPVPEIVMPFLKQLAAAAAESTAEGKAESGPAEHPVHVPVGAPEEAASGEEAPGETESILKVLSRALARR